MARPYIEKVFDYRGYKCVCAFNDSGYRLGYVGVPKGHMLYGKDYTEHLNISINDIRNRNVEKIGVFSILGQVLDDSEKVRIEAYFDVHGGITFADGGVDSKYPIDGNLWWFGFDCAHYMDGRDFSSFYKYFPDKKVEIDYLKHMESMFKTEEEVRSLEYVESECKHLVDQIIELETSEKPKDKGNKKKSKYKRGQKLYSK